MRTYHKSADIPITMGSKAQWLARGFVVCKWAKPKAKAKLMMPGFIHEYNLYGVEDVRATNSRIGQRKRDKYFAALPQKKLGGYDE